MPQVPGSEVKPFVQDVYSGSRSPALTGASPLLAEDRKTDQRGSSASSTLWRGRHGEHRSMRIELLGLSRSPRKAAAQTCRF